ncbi:uncharacterized protein LOC144142337 isoform X5 [Haemaphysalis longicornis]
MLSARAPLRMRPRLHVAALCGRRAEPGTRYLGDSQQQQRGEGGGYARRVRLGKRLFSTALFGGTLVAVLYFRRRRQAQQGELFRDCVLLPRDDNYAANMYFYSYRGFVFPGMVIRSLPKVQALKARPDDIFVVSFPKTGTTWVQEIVYLIATGLDFGSASERNLEQRFPFLEYFYPGVSTIESSPDVRLIKTHLPYSLLPDSVHTENPKIIYVMRNPKDVCVSLFHFTRLIKETGYEGSFGDFFRSFLKGHGPGRGDPEGGGVPGAAPAGGRGGGRGRALPLRPHGTQPGHQLRALAQAGLPPPTRRGGGSRRPLHAERYIQAWVCSSTKSTHLLP